MRHPAHDLVQRRRLEVEDVHAHLDLAGTRQAQPDRLHARHPAARLADRARDVLGDGDVVGVEHEVVRDERIAGAHEGDPGPARSTSRGPASGRSSPAAIRRTSSSSPPLRKKAGPATSAHEPVQEHGKPDVGAEPFARLASAVCLGQLPLRPLERDERHDVDRSDAGMDAVVPAQVDELDRARRARDERLDQLSVVAREREDRAVVVRVGVDVEERRSRRERPPDLGDRRAVAPLGHVRHGLQHDPYPTST